jgi:hypothetical protein
MKDASTAMNPSSSLYIVKRPTVGQQMAILESTVQRELQDIHKSNITYEWLTETVIWNAPLMQPIYLGAVLFRLIKYSTQLPPLTRDEALQRIHQIIN